MRDIKFRGKRVDNNQWIYGSFIFRLPTEFNDKTYTAIIIFDKYVDSQYNAYLELEVIPETVGQFTGLTDKNGKEIYEGDILRDGKGGDGVVVFASPQFVVQVALDIYSLAEGKVNVTQLEYTEVIGNIHDNPELLKQ